MLCIGNIFLIGIEVSAVQTPLITLPDVCHASTTRYGEASLRGRSINRDELERRAFAGLEETKFARLGIATPDRKYHVCLGRERGQVTLEPHVRSAPIIAMTIKGNNVRETYVKADQVSEIAGAKSARLAARKDVANGISNGLLIPSGERPNRRRWCLGLPLVAIACNST